MEERYQKRVPPIYANSFSGVKVYAGVDLHTQQQVVIKEMTTGDAEAANKFLRESWIQAILNHPNICKLYGQYFYMENEQFICGLVIEQMPRDLQQLIDELRRRNERISEETIWIYLQQIISALAYAQEKCVCHRDIKPANILIGEGNVVKLADLGAAKHQLKVTTLQTVEGTPDFLSPLVRRQLMDNLRTHLSNKVKHDPYKSDVYSLGMTCIVMALWDIPAELRNFDHLQQSLERTVENLPGFSQRLKDFVLLMVIVDEDSRPDFQALKRSSLLQGDPDPPLPRVQLQAGRCLFCLEAANPATLFSLLCDPSHCFCSGHCFKRYIERETQGYIRALNSLKCPICQQLLDKEFIHAAFGGEYPPIPEGHERCNYCRAMILPLGICECQHRFCLLCFKTMVKVYGKRPKVCPEDQVPFNRAMLKHHFASCSIF